MAHRIADVPPPAPVLRVLARGTALVQDYRALHETGTNRFHGWEFDGSLGPEFTDTVTGQKMRHGGRVKQANRVVEIASDHPFRNEYLVHLRNGDLWAADPETAAAAGVPFEPHFAGEHPEVSAKHGLEGAKLRERLVAHGFPPDAGPAEVPWDTAFKPKGKDAPAPAAPAPAAAAPSPAAPVAATSK